jgi:Fe-Mn family superoxide dismutase
MYTLPALPYAYDALEPYIDTATMVLHHTKHHQAYLDGLLAALAQAPELASQPLEQLLAQPENLPASVRQAIINHGGGYYNHTLFWQYMSPRGGGEPRGHIAAVIKDRFGSYAAFIEQFSQAAKLRFGSGWAWLVLNQAGDLAITTTANQDSPLSLGQKPLLGLDVWEHAYYLKYTNKRVDYIAAWWQVVNWELVDSQLRD